MTRKRALSCHRLVRLLEAFPRKEKPNRRLLRGRLCSPAAVRDSIFYGSRCPCAPGRSVVVAAIVSRGIFFPTLGGLVCSNEERREPRSCGGREGAEAARNDLCVPQLDPLRCSERGILRLSSFTTNNERRVRRGKTSPFPFVPLVDVLRTTKRGIA